MLHAFLQMDIQVLRRVFVVHVLRHVKVDAADEVDCLLERLQINEHVAVDREAEQTLQARSQALHAVCAAARIDGVDLHKAPVSGRDRRVARDGQKRDGVRVRVQMGDDDGVGAGTVAVGAADEDVIDAVAQGFGLLGGDILLRRLLRLSLLRRHVDDGGLRHFRLGLRRLRRGERRTLHRLYQQLPRCKRAAGEQQHNGCDQDRCARTARERAFFRMCRAAAIAK